MTWSKPWASTASPLRGLPHGGRARRQGGARSGTAPWTAGPYRYVWIDALTQKVREAGRVVNVSAVVATAVNHQGQREIVGFDIVTAEDTAAWTEFLRGLVARGLAGVELVISDAHGGHQSGHRHGPVRGHLAAVPDALHGEPGFAGPQADWPMIATLVRSIFEQADRDATWAQLGDVVDKLTTAGFCDAAVYVLDAADDILAFSAFPVEHWPKIRSNNPQVIYRQLEGVHDVADVPPFGPSLGAGRGYLQPSNTQARGRFGVRSEGGVARFAA